VIALATRITVGFLVAPKSVERLMVDFWFDVRTLRGSK